MGILVFGVFALISFALSISLVYGIVRRAEGGNGEEGRYHLALYLPGKETTFFASVVAGAQSAAEDMEVALSIHYFNPDCDEILLAAYTGVDGLIVCPYMDDRLAREYLEALSARDIPLVIIDHHIPADQPWPFVGSNNFEVGRQMGNFIRRSQIQNPHIAIIYSEKAPGIFAERELVELGIAGALADLDSPSLYTFKTELGPLAAEDLLYRLYMTMPEINALIFTDVNDTITAAQILVDLNLVGSVQLLGFGDDSLILQAIRKGIIAGTVVVNPEKIGYEAVASLVGLISTGYTPSTVDTGVQVIEVEDL